MKTNLLPMSAALAGAALTLALAAPARSQSDLSRAFAKAPRPSKQLKQSSWRDACGLRLRECRRQWSHLQNEGNGYPRERRGDYKYWQDAYTNKKYPGETGYRELFGTSADIEKRLDIVEKRIQRGQKAGAERILNALEKSLVDWGCANDEFANKYHLQPHSPPLYPH